MSCFTSRTIREILFLFFHLWAFVRTSCLEVSSLETSVEANSVNLVLNNRKLKQQREANEGCHDKALLWHICFYNNCSLTIASEVFSTVRQRPCTFNNDTRLWDCVDLSVDERSYEALKFAECQATCLQQQVSCQILPRIESINGVRIPSDSCPNGQFPAQYNCNCQIINYSEMIAYTQRILGPHGGCTPVCYERDKSLNDCTTDRPNLSLGTTNTSQHNCGTLICTLQGCGAIVTSAARSIIASEKCTFTQASRWWDCGGVLEIDEPGYTWATQGTCISACDVTVASNTCVFTVRYGKHPTQWDVPEETEVDKASREKALSIKTQNKTLINSNTTVEGGGLEEGKIRSSEAVSSLSSEDLEEEDVSTGKVSSTIEKEPVIEEEEEVDSDLTTEVKREKDSNSKLPRSSTTRTRVRSPPSPSPSLNRGKVMKSSTPNTPTPSFAVVPNTPLTSDSPRGQELPRSVAISSPMEPSPDPPSSTNELPPLPPPVGVRTRLIEVSIESSEDGTTSGEGELFLGPWLPCPQVCNFSTIEVSHRERFILCRSKVSGIALPSSYCSALETPKTTSFEECPTKEDPSICQRQYIIKFNAWSACSQSCTANQEEGTRKRDFECYQRLGSHSLVLVPNSSCAAPDRSTRTRTCVPRPCDPVVYRTTDWSTCNCNSRTQTRTVSCIRIGASRSTTNLAPCKSRGLILPRTRQNCTCDQTRGPGRLLLQGSDPCAGNNCSGHGTCQNGSCICEEGFFGPLCDQTAHLNSWNDSCSQNDSPSDCCESGISDSSFTCCSYGSSLDRNGACCDGQVDVCGECNGPAKFVDALGKCCSKTLDAAGVCCESGEVDECGVCDGLGMSCDFRLIFKSNQLETSDSCVRDLVSQTLPFTPDTAEPEIKVAIQEYRFIAFIPGSFVSIGRSVKLVEQLIRDKLPEFASNSCEDSVLELEAVQREHVLGNHVCEIGETVFINSRTFTGFFQDSASWSGAQDCPFVIASCPLPRNTSRVGEIDKPCSQRGTCSFAGEAQCHCFRGYLGEACDQCELGYTPRNGLCIRTKLNTYELDTNEEDLSEVQEEESEGKRRQFVFIAVTVITVVLGVILSLSCVVYLTFHARDSGFFGRDNHSQDRIVNWAHFSVGTSRTSRLFYGPLKSTSSSSVSGRVSLKTEPSMMPPFDRKSPPPLDCTSPPAHEGPDRNSPPGVPAPNPFLPSSSSQPATFYPVNSFTNTTVDVEGNAQKTQRMPSFDDNHMKVVQARATERQAASLGELDNVELMNCPPPEMSIEEGKVRRHSGTAMAIHSTRQFVHFPDTSEDHKSVQCMLPDHGSIASLKEYARRSSMDEKAISSKGGQASSKMIDMESTNAFEFALPMPQEGQQTHHPSASDPSGHLMSYLETPTSSQRLRRMLSQSSENPAGSTSTPPTSNRFYSPNTEVIKEKERWLRKSGEGY